MKLSDTQAQALSLLSTGAFVRTRAGWHPPGNGGVVAFATATVTSLAARGLVAIASRGPRKASARITATGRRALENGHG